MGTEYLDTTGTRAFGRIGPLTTVVPFSYRDGTTFQKLLYSLRDYMTNVLHPHFDGEIERIIGEFNIAIDNVENKTAGLEDVIREFFEKIESYVNESVDPIAAAAVKKHLDDFVKDPGTLDLFNRVFASRITEDTARKQSALYGTFFSNLRNKRAVSICALGDSTTYGYDLTSGDRIPAPAGTLPDGSVHRSDRAAKQYPAVLQSRLREMYGKDASGKELVSVINRGYTGDTTKLAFNRWISGHSAGLTLISLGINDANHSATFSITEHMEWYEKLILREINDYGSAVVILTPFKQNYHNPGPTTDTYRVAIAALANKYGIPVVDTESWLSGFGDRVYAPNDGTHMNSKGYEIIGTRAAALFVGDGPMVPFRVSGGSRIATRPTMDNMLLGPIGAHSMAVHSGGGSVQENTAPNPAAHISALMKDSASVYYAFYAETADLVCHFPLGIFKDNTLKIELDFGIEQPNNIGRALVGLDEFDTVNQSSSVTITSKHDHHITKLSHTSKVLQIASPGWHTVKFTTTGNFPATQDGLRIYGIEFMNYREYQGAIRQKSYRMPIPEYFTPESDSAAIVTSFRVPWRSVMDVLGLVDWERDLYQAPALKVTVRTWDQGISEYLLVVNPGKWDFASANYSAIEYFTWIRNLNTTETPNPARLRELSGVTFDLTKWELVFTLKTEGKTGQPNFVVDIAVI